MARPRLEDGWVRYAHELDAALAASSLSRGSRIVLHVAIGQIFGPAKLPSARLSPTEIAARTGQHRPNVSRALRELTDSGVLRRLDDGSYAFNKDYQTWTAKGSPMLTPAEVEWCREAPSRAMSHRGRTDQPDSDPSGIRFDTPPRIKSDTDEVSTLIHPRIKSDTRDVSNLIRFSPPPNNPLVGNGEFKSLPAGGPAGATPLGPLGLAETIEEARRLLGDDIARFVADRGDSIARSVVGPKAPDVPSRFSCYRAALRRVRRKLDGGEPVDNFHALALKIAADYAAEGIPPGPLGVSRPAEASAEERGRSTLERLKARKDSR